MGNMSDTSHFCPKPDHGMLPFIIHDAAMKGRTDQVMSWLEKGGDINASDMTDRTLLYMACEFNHIELLRKLLKHPNVHVNQMAGNRNPFRGQSSTPLSIAIMRGHLECAEVLVNDATSLCRVSVNQEIRYGNNHTSLIQMAAQRNLWKAVGMFLSNGFLLNGDDALGLLKMAVNCRETDIIKDILKQDFPVTTKDEYPLKEIYERDMWEETGIEALFKKLVLKGNDSCKIILSSMLEKNDWKGMESLLKIINNAVVIHIDLSQAVKERKSEDVARLLSQEKFGMEVLNGTLLVAAISDPDEEVVALLLDQKYEYSTDVLNDSLILASLNGQIVLLLSLLQKETFNFTTLDRAKVVAPRSTIEKLLDRALKRVAKTIMPIEKDDEKEAKDD